MTRFSIRSCTGSLLVLAMLSLGSSTIPTSATSTPQSSAFVETFDGAPSQPEQVVSSSTWDISIHKRAPTTLWEGPFEAGHGTDCTPAPATHTITSFDQSVYKCRNHLMTALYASDYGAVYLTPNQMVDFSQEATIRFDMSTARTSQRDWVDVWITPYSQNLVDPLDTAVDLSGPPRNAIQIRMDLVRGAFFPIIYRDFQPFYMPGQNTWLGYEEFLEPSAVRRDTFEIHLSPDHVSMGMPAYNDFKWFDLDIPELGWTQGIVQFGHHSYNPLKECHFTVCAPNTWHWDNFQISPAVPFSMVPGNPRSLFAKNPVATLDAPAPANAFMRFGGLGKNIQVSFDGGTTWKAATMQQQSAAWLKEEHSRSYWMPIPEGTTTVQFRATNWYGGDWVVRDVSVWSGVSATSSISSGLSRVMIPLNFRAK